MKRSVVTISYAQASKEDPRKGRSTLHHFSFLSPPGEAWRGETPKPLCQLLEELRNKYRFQIVGYVVMPAFIQMLLSEPGEETVKTVILALRQRYQRRYNVSARSDEPAWEKTFSDVHVVSPDRIIGCLSLMHEAPVKAGLVEEPSDWEWSSARRYVGLPEGVVSIDPVSTGYTA